ncbi:MAG: hypothetical protein EP297_14875 [Gammaproteobacteria bacterium]|nr:MAG: hypothetical protein EP297_14875 [Gammaproteobacteria bacterium]
MKHVIHMIILAFALVMVTPVIAQTMDQRVMLFNGMTEQQKKAGLLVVHDYLKAQLKELSLQTQNPGELSRTMSIGAYTNVLQYELSNKLGWESLAEYHKTAARVALGYLLGDIGYDEYQQRAMNNKGFFDSVLAEVNMSISQMKQMLDGRMKDMERVGKMIYEESIRIADEAKAANKRKKPS